MASQPGCSARVPAPISRVCAACTLSYGSGTANRQRLQHPQIQICHAEARSAVCVRVTVGPRLARMHACTNAVSRGLTLLLARLNDGRGGLLIAPIAASLRQCMWAVCVVFRFERRSSPKARTAERNNLSLL